MNRNKIVYCEGCKRNVSKPCVPIAGYCYHPDNIRTCDICGFETSARECKLRCDNCGATRDCSDP